MRTLGLCAVLAAALLAGPARAQQNNQATYDAALKSMQSSDPMERAFGLVGLALIGKDGVNASRQVVTSLYDNNEEVRKQAAAALNAVNPTIAAPVLELVRGTDNEQRLKAVEQLGKLGKDAAPALPALMAFLNQAKGADKAAVIKTLALVSPDDKALVSQLTGLALKDSDPAVRNAALQALPKMGDAAGQIAAGLKALDSEKDAQARVNAINVLAAAGKGNADVMTRLQGLTTDPSAEVKAAAKKAVDQLKANK